MTLTEQELEVQWLYFLGKSPMFASAYSALPLVTRQRIKNEWMSSYIDVKSDTYLEVAEMFGRKSKENEDERN